ncbi:MAG TPA: hypothetical protein ENJ82_03050, partial [Bacteroidetes bacterium]|nr:hypothetical protein [Bacteroidota bacterium]
MASNGFSDSISAPNGQGMSNPRDISNALGSQSSFMANEMDRSDVIWGWGQFIDHDINFNDDNLTDTISIPVPPCDSMFDPNCTGTVKIRMFRSQTDPNSGTSTSNPLRHVNAITSFIDGSGVYGSTQARADWLRTHAGGKLKMSTGNLLPWNTIDGEFASAIDPTAPFMLLDGSPLPTKYYIGGDIRINEQPGLTAFHTLWVREHNRLCDELIVAHPSWSDEELFQRARKIVGALIQAVTYEEFLPSMGIHLPAWTSYDSAEEPQIFNMFSASAYRFGHTMINGNLIRYKEDGTAWGFGSVDLRDAFFNPLIIKDEGGIEPFFRGMAAQEHQMVDPLMMDDLRNFLFGPPGAGGLDLLAINIQRARERGLPNYNTIRSDLSLTPHTSFASLTSDVDLQNKISMAYSHIDSIDPWVGFMSEDHLPGSIMGEGLQRILSLQFSTLRKADRYYYENDPAFSPQEINELKSTLLSKIMLRNTSIDTLQDSVFLAVPRNQIVTELIPFR